MIAHRALRGILPTLLKTALLLNLSFSGAQASAAPEKQTWLGLPVEFAAQSYAFKKGPAIELDKLKVMTATPIEISRAWMMPDWADWITEFKTRKVRVVAGEIVAKPSSLARLGVVDGPSTRFVTRIEFSSLKLMFGDTPLSLPAGEMQFGDDGAMSRIRVQLEGGISLDLSPREGGRLGVLVQTGNFKPQLLSAFRFDSVVAQGEMADDYVLLDRIGANGDGGSLSGVLRLVSAGKFLLEGELKMESVRARDVIDRLYPRAVVDGILSGNFKISSSADTLAELGKSVVVEGSYVLKSGSIDRFGLLEGMRRSGTGVVGGGLLRFEQISGKFGGRTGAPAQANFQGLSSGALRGSSNFVIDPDGRLKGSVSGTLALPGGEVISRNFELSGKASAPSLIAR
ncbi:MULTISPECIES: hypothetical protein [unclassified Uliginosibacterium]|uniref:hypothetical protein n=1 Tax=unclassified Uliginosibacterium TaxID=2621521 RepID=UPI000C7A301A|nr:MULTISPECIES: hypothetical protein [unclassified Uliginosibacterium]MDO6385967.1 hypothetical protein [Uliginosibacterium sp. 31-12]PLK49977.1 hypothetical protein C0V76_06100 [Uliginosibacterium sp. TH139]